MTIETAILSAMILICIGAAAMFLRGIVRDSFERVAFDSAQVGAQTTISVERADSQSGPGRHVAGRASRVLVDQWRLFGLIFCLVLNLVLSLLMFRRGRREGRKSAVADGLAHDQVPEEAWFERRQQLLRVLGDSMDELCAGSVRVRQVMTRRFARISTNAGPREVLDAMRQFHTRQVVVLNGDDSLVGLVTRDQVPDHDQPGWTAGPAAAAVPVAAAEMPLLQAVSTILQCRVGCLPVVDAGRVEGLVSVADLLMAMQCLLQLVARHGDPIRTALGIRRATTISELDSVPRTSA